MPAQPLVAASTAGRRRVGGAVGIDLPFPEAAELAAQKKIRIVANAIASSIFARHPALRIVLNGGLISLDQIIKESEGLDGAMIGREAYQNPWILTEMENCIFGNKNILTREEAALAMIPYAEKQYRDYGTPVKSITRHMVGLYHGQKGARAWRRHLAMHSHLNDSCAHVIEDALQQIPSHPLPKSA